MTGPISTPRKQRTREHVLADLSINHAERFILEEGHTAERQHKDYGYDLLMRTFDVQGYSEPGWVFFQFKAAEALAESGGDCTFDLDIRDYNLWMFEPMPVILVLYDASQRRAFWLYVQNYFRDASSRQPKKGAKTVRVRVPKRQRLNRRAVARLRAYKQKTLKQSATGGSHG